MTDQELIDAAGRAMGLKIEWHSEMAGSFPVYKNDAGSGYIPWNPLRNDGDAFRLACDLGFSIIYMDGAVHVFRSPHAVTHEYGLVKPHYQETPLACESVADSKHKAARRAVTKAAAISNTPMPSLRGAAK